MELMDRPLCIRTELLDNWADGSGGAIASWDRTLVTVEASTILNNGAFYSGGGVYVHDLVMVHSDVTGNVAEVNGGGIRARKVWLEESTISDNVALKGNGGGVWGAVEGQLRHDRGQQSSRGWWRSKWLGITERIPRGE